MNLKPFELLTNCSPRRTASMAGSSSRRASDLTNVTQRARAQSCPDDVEVIVLTQEDNLGVGGELSYPPGGFDSIQFGETDVQQNYVRFQVLGFLNRF